MKRWMIRCGTINDIFDGETGEDAAANALKQAHDSGEEVSYGPLMEIIEVTKKAEISYWATAHAFDHAELPEAAKMMHEQAQAILNK